MMNQVLSDGLKASRDALGWSIQTRLLEGLVEYRDDYEEIMPERTKSDHGAMREERPKTREERIALSRDLSELLVTQRRQDIPIRASFVRNIDPSLDTAPDTPLRRLVRLGGSDGALLKLYIALIWRCSAAPFDTEVSARLWSELLALPANKHNVGARRVAKALNTLAKHGLIKVDRISGDTSRITLLNESGPVGTKQETKPYTLPFAGKDPQSYYLRVPVELWTSGKIHELTTPGIAMLLVLLAEQPKDGGPVWWSTRRFETRIGLSSSTRSRGTKELFNAGILLTRRGMRPSDRRTFSKESTVTIYTLQGVAHPTSAQRKKTVDAVKKAHGSS